MDTSSRPPQVDLMALDPQSFTIVSSGATADRIALGPGYHVRCELDGTLIVRRWDGNNTVIGGDELAWVIIHSQERMILRSRHDEVTIHLGFRDREAGLTLRTGPGVDLLRQVHQFVRAYLAVRYVGHLPEIAVSSSDGEQFAWPPSVEDQDAIVARMRASAAYAELGPARKAVRYVMSPPWETAEHDPRAEVLRGCSLSVVAIVGMMMLALLVYVVRLLG